MTLIGSRCKCSNILSRAVLIARWLFFAQCLFQTSVRVMSHRSGFYSETICKLFGSRKEKISEKRRYSVHRRWLIADIQAIYSVGVPPLPIPNREVKPDSADGTALSCGRVGHRHFFSKRALVNAKALFFVLISEKLIPAHWLWADGIALSCGRVGHRHFFSKRALVNTKALFLCL